MTRGHVVRFRNNSVSRVTALPDENVFVARHPTPSAIPLLADVVLRLAVKSRDVRTITPNTGRTFQRIHLLRGIKWKGYGKVAISHRDAATFVRPHGINTKSLRTTNRQSYPLYSMVAFRATTINTCTQFKNIGLPCNKLLQARALSVPQRMENAVAIGRRMRVNIYRSGPSVLPLQLTFDLLVIAGSLVPFRMTRTPRTQKVLQSNLFRDVAFNS